MNITQIFELVSKQIQNEMEAARAALKHPGMKGAATEQIVSDFLQKYLPKGLAITSGILVDSRGGVSDQVDIIIYDANKTPLLFLSGGLRVIPVECAYAAIEVKMRLDAEKLRRCIKNMESVKALQRLAYHEQKVIVQNTSLYGIDKDFWGETLYFVFAFETLVSVETMRDILLDHAKKTELSKRIDSIFCADLGYLANSVYGILDALPQEGSKLVLVKDNALLLFYTCLMRYMTQTRIPHFNFVEYVKKIPFYLQELEQKKA